VGGVAFISRLSLCFLNTEFANLPPKSDWTILVRMWVFEAVKGCDKWIDGWTQPATWPGLGPQSNRNVTKEFDPTPFFLPREAVRTWVTKKSEY